MDEPSANDYDVHRPHDSLFRAVFSDPAAAVGFLRAYLPESVSAGLQWSTLALRNNTFIDDELRDSESDLLFAVQRQSGRPAWLYVLTVETVAGELKGRIAQLTMMAVYRDQWPVLQRVVPLLAHLYRRGGVDELRPFVVYVLATHGEEICRRFFGELRRQVPAREVMP